MLHAELAGKIAPDADDIARREDVLTSTVFGTLFLADAWGVLLDWFERSHPVGGIPALVRPASLDRRGYWFWPRLHGAEPDVVIRVGTLLLIIEAKYLSGKSSAGVAMPSTAAALVETSDQLVREWRACSSQIDTSGYPADLCDAIESCTSALVYLVRRRRWTKELRAVEESLRQVVGARMYILSWEDLDDVLGNQSIRWSTELRAYLHRRDVAAFRGFGDTILVSTGSALGRWTCQRPVAATDLRAAFTMNQLVSLNMFASREPAFVPPAPSMRWARTFEPGSLARLALLAVRPSKFDPREREHG